MTVDTDLGRVQYAGNNTTRGPFTFAGPVQNDADLKVIDNITATNVPTTLVLNTDYTVVGSGPNSESVDIFYTVGRGNLLTGHTVTILRNIPLTQQTDYVPNDPFPAESHEAALDKLTLIEQQQNESINRAFRLPETADVSLVPQYTDVPVAGMSLAFIDSMGTLGNGPSITDILNAQPNAAAAAASAAAASASQTAAQNAQAAAEAAAAGMKWRPPVRAATTLNIILSGTQTIDGYVAVVSDRILVKNQTTASQNGVYVVASGAWTRATDADTWLELEAQVVVAENGAAIGNDIAYICTVAPGGTIGTTAVTWVVLPIPIVDGAVTRNKLAAGAVGSDNVTSSKTANYTATNVDDFIPCNASGGTFTVTAYTPVGNSGRRLTIKKTDSTLIQVTVATAAGTIDGAATKKLSTQYEDITIESDGTNWNVVYRGQIITPWVVYTPTFSAGFGTPTGVSMWSRRNGDTLEIRGYFSAGTTAASVATITMGFNGVNAPSGLTSDSTKNAGVSLCGHVVTSIVGTFDFNTVIDVGVNTINFSSQNPSNAGLVFLTGSGMTSSGTRLSLTASVPITGWES